MLTTLEIVLLVGYALFFAIIFAILLKVNKKEGFEEQGAEIFMMFPIVIFILLLVFALTN